MSDLKNGDLLASELTKREYLAALVLGGVSSDPSYESSIPTLAEIAVEMADALLLELEKER